MRALWEGKTLDEGGVKLSAINDSMTAKQLGCLLEMGNSRTSVVDWANEREYIAYSMCGRASIGPLAYIATYVRTYVKQTD